MCASSSQRGADGMARRPASLVDVLRERAEAHPTRLAYTFLVDGESVEARLTYAELDRRARAIGVRLRELGAVGQRVMLVCPPGLDYVAGYWGCLYAGAVVVPAYPPRVNRTTDTLLAIVRDAGARAILTATQTRGDVERDFARAVDLADVTLLTTDEIADDAAALWRHPGADRETLAFLQYTSGSTGTPKGVMVTHGNLIANMTAAWDAVAMTPDSVPMSWLPPFHDMGLISGVIHPIFAGLSGVLMSPAAFIQRPVRWLRAISRYQVTHSGGPPFAYDYCLRRITPDQLDGIDLSSWVTAYVGAEPIRVETLERFAATYAPYGLRASALLPCYGMAEATLMVSGGPHRERPLEFAADAAALELDRLVAAPGRGGARVLAACGRPLDDTTVVIAHPERLTRCGPGEVGEIWVANAAVAQGYWGKPAESEQTFRAHLADGGGGPFLRTGDLGFLHDGQVYVTGRQKDLIILQGRNHYPQDVEQTVERCHPALRPSGVAAFAVDHEDGEQLVVVQEVDAAHVRTFDADAVIGAIRQAVTEEHDIAVAAVVLIRPGSIPKTSSGKIRRRATREAYRAGRLPVVASWARPDLTPPAQDLGALAAQPDMQRGAEGAPDGRSAPERGEGAGRLPIAAPERRLEREARPADEIARWLVARLAEILQVNAATIDIREPFARYGLTSVEAVGLSGDLETWLGRRLPPTLAYDYPSIEALARWLASDGDAVDEPGVRRGDPDEPIAIVGMGCRLPGAASPDALWRLLRDGVDAVRDVPPDRWPVDASYDPDPDAPGKIATRAGGFLDRVDGFDADFFRIAAREAVKMDPQQRLLLEVAWEALEDAGQPVDRLAGTRTGVFVGICSSDYARLHIGSGDPGAIDAYAGTGVAFSVAAGRISYVLGLQGPNLAIDTSCSSSLVAVHLACQSLHTGESDLALAGGVNLILTPETSIFLSKAHALAPDGRCKTFSAAADGYARGEGCGVVVLKRLSDAVAAGDRVLALIRGSAVNHDGHTNGLTAPNGPAQEAVIREALARAGVEPSEVGYVEAHGTGTPLGDPIEVQALAAVLGRDRPADRPLAIGSIKTNVGHLEAAAGVAGLLKVVLAMQRGLIPPHLHFDVPSPYIPWSEAPVFVPTTLSPWPMGNGRRIAGVSAFGFSGTNAHVILEEAPELPAATLEAAPLDDAPVLLPLSARDPAALRALAAAYRDFLGPAGTTAALSDIAYTAAARRSHHQHRLAVVGRSREELAEQLDAFARGELHIALTSDLAPSASASALEPRPAGEAGGRDVAGRSTEPRLPELRQLAARYVSGEDLDWQALFPTGGRCVSLPGYPWQRERFWVEPRPTPWVTRTPAVERIGEGSRAHLAERQEGHPLLGPRVELAADPGSSVWETELDADSLPWPRDHQVGGLVVMPAAAYLDLALAAAGQVLGAGALDLEGAAFGQTLVLRPGARQRLQVVASQEGPGAVQVRCYSRPDGEVGGQSEAVPPSIAWRLHAEIRVRGGTAGSPGTGGGRPHELPAVILARCPEEIAGADHYAALAARGLAYGPSFQRVERVWRGAGEALGRLTPPGAGPDLGIDLTLLDGCFQLLGPAFAVDPAFAGDELALPIGLERLRVGAGAALRGPLWCHAVARPVREGDVLVGDVVLCDERGVTVLEAQGLRVRRLAGAPPHSQHQDPHGAGGPQASRDPVAAFGAPPGPDRAAGPHVAEQARAWRLAVGGPGDGRSPAARDDGRIEAEAGRLASYLTELVARAVGRPAARIDRDRPLMDLGLDSLMAMELRNRIQADLGLVVPLTTFLQGPSVADLAAALADGAPTAEAGAPADPTVPSSHADVSAAAADRSAGALSPSPGADLELPLSHGQRALWLTHQLAPRSTAYHIMFAARLHGVIDEAAMRRAARLLVERHAALRTTYGTDRDGRPVQRVRAQMTDVLAVIDASAWSEAELRTRLAGEADQPFDLERGPLLRLVLYRRSDADQVLLLAVHHLAVDFWSLEVLVEELRALYEAERSGRPAALPPARPYAEFVRWQADLLDGPAGEQLWRYWERKLAGELPVLALPTDRPRPRVQTFRGAVHDVALDAETTARLKALARAEGATPYATLLAAFAALLARYTGQDDLLVGSPMAGRGRADFERTVGYLVNVLPLRADLAGRPTFRELLRRTRDTVLEALDHQDFPFPLLVERLLPARDPGQAPLVQVLFIWYRSALLEGSAALDPAAEMAASQPPAPATGGLAPDILAWEQRGAPYDLMLLMTEARGSLLGRWQYNADLFDAATIARMAEHFRRLVEGVLLDPDRPVDSVRILTAAERVQQLVSWNDTQAAFPADACLHHLFEAQARRTPDAPALVWQHDRLTYRELNRRANRVARRLRALGVGPEVLVAVCAERTPPLVAAILGVLKAGGAYVPLDPAYPRARLAFMLGDADARVVVTQRSLAHLFDGLGAEVVCLDDRALADGGEGDDENPTTGVRPDNLAYLIYTSGSTGQPKGVMIEHHGPVALAAWARDAFGDGALAGVLASTSICFDLSVFELFAPLSWGGAVILAANVLELPRLPAAERVTLVNTVPSAVAELLRGGRLPSSVRVVALAGEPLPHETAQAVYRHEHVRAVYNLYGPTEDTVYSTWALVERGIADPPPIGRPLPNRRVYLLDAGLQPVPVGVPGEVYTAGVGVARGYRNRPELTAERFLPSPFDGEAGERLYRVGDLARYRPDGTIELLGRLDDQVKIRGYRIELGEVEAQLRRHPALREAAVAARDDRHGTKQLVAYLVPERAISESGAAGGDGASRPALPTVSELRRFLQRELPDYMVPTTLVWLDALPRTPNGKIDRRALPEPGLERPSLDAAYVAPRTSAEALLAEIWADVLDVDRVGIHDSFFDLGGASFASVAIAARANEAGLPLSADLLFAYPTIAELSALAEQLAADGPGPGVRAEDGGPGTEAAYGLLGRVVQPIGQPGVLR